MRNEPHLSNYLHEDLIEAGCDEAGRGPLAGPVYAAAVILPKDFHHPLLNDSKKMTEKARETLRPIIEREALAWAVVEVSAEEIDTINILNASITGMQRAVRKLSIRPEFLLIDEHMRRLAKEFPQYGWDRNMGYPTKEHIDAIIAHGYTPHHRKSFHVKQLEPTLF